MKWMRPLVTPRNLSSSGWSMWKICFNRVGTSILEFISMRHHKSNKDPFTFISKEQDRFKYLCYGRSAGKERRAFCVNEWKSEYTVTRVRNLEGVREKSGSGSEELWSRREAERTWLQLVCCALMHTVSYFGKPIRQKRKQWELKSIFRLEIQEETSEYIY